MSKPKSGIFMKIILVIVNISIIFAGYVAPDENNLNIFNTYYKKHKSNKFYFKDKLYFNAYGAGLMGNSLNIFYQLHKNLLLTCNTNSAFVMTLFPSWLTHNIVDLYYNQKYFFGIQYNTGFSIKEYGLNIGFIKYHKLFFPSYISINNDLIYQKDNSENLNNFISKINFEYGINLKYFSVIYKGYYVINQEPELEESLARNYLMLKIKIPKSIQRDKKWSINFFIGNSYDINTNRESDNYNKAESNIIQGVSITF